MSFRLYRSSAGSGKTYTLVKEYLALVLKNPEKFKHILAVTFTNKAAAEMKERILQALKNLAKKEDPVLEKFLKKDNPDLLNIPYLSSELLTQLLHNYSDFSIMTIDSFIHKVLRAFALEIGLPLSFTIDLNYEKIYTYVVERLIGSVGKDEHITRVILDFVFARVREEKSWNIEGDIRGFVGELFNEKNADWAKEVGSFGPDTFNRYREQLNEYQDDFIRRVKELGNQGLNMIEEADLSLDDFAYGKNGAAGFFRVCRELNERDLTKFKLRKRFVDEAWITSKAKEELKSRVENLLSSGLAGVHAQIMELYETNFKLALTAHYMMENIFLAAIVSEIKQLIEEYKARNNVVPISEFNVKVYEI
ncbi:MAG: UvrD-helicase domain-containing protein, partial [bacterium]|nr:UvrD-helicase domain-containing protein [bacterium]